MDPKDFAAANYIIRRTCMGETWSGKFPVKNKMGQSFLAYVTLTPSYDDVGILVALTAVTSKTQQFQGGRTPKEESSCSEMNSGLNQSETNSTAEVDSNTQKPLQEVITSKISNLVCPITVFFSF